MSTPGPDRSRRVSSVLIEGLAERARALVPGSGRAVLGITGAPGAGKSTLVEHLKGELARHPPGGTTGPDWVAHVPMDGFHLADVQLDRLGLRDRKGAPETFDAAGFAALLNRLRSDTENTIYAPGFERELEQPIAAAIAVSPQARLVITEGNYLLLDDPAWAAVRSALDEVWYCEVEPEVRLERLVARHVQFGKQPSAARAWAGGVDQPNADLVERTRDRADLVISLDSLER
ncbi:nucleoside/nucleotide kinase family protein [Nostocoides sp. HKS02]|uniref:nucleoside/nucleotide kinase family protein n=1 Tax=Nostocoides sp. HKS02 TaxID=1813880 RepID=UPI0012B4C664|nr:nucleoside/nucleotide kinase family protein [Tetrasphaera sp. HKS02]QGN56745.1 nucleoside/nucleotide kinase family protein [Tetrasphaera sp. HKS02]